jgi:endonuclease/exonuclease/phosphatase family metal-dependent hydrolase
MGRTRHDRRSFIRRTLVALATLPVLLVMAGATPAHAASERGAAAQHRGGLPGFVSVMTENMDEGTDFTPLFTATTLAQFDAEAVVTIQEVFASNIPSRAGQVAAAIALLRPDVVSLQEVSLWQTPLGNLDALSALTSALDADGAHYSVASVLPEFGAAVTLPNLGTVSFLDRDALLVRTDRQWDGVSVANVQSGHYPTLLTLPTVIGPLTVPRGWISADATTRGRTVRIIATHLESFVEPVQFAQGAELLAGPANTSLPVVIAGDLNTGPKLGGGFTTPTYQEILGGGFSDTWSVTRPGNPGMTNPLHAEDPYGPSTPDQRIDLVLDRGHLVPLFDIRVGTTPSPATGLWPSDHTGVVSWILVP